MSNFLSEALAEITAKRKERERKAESLKNELRADDTYRALESKRDAIIFSIARLNSQNADLGNLNSDLEETKRLIALRLKELGRDESELSALPDCTVCFDRGTVNGRICECVEKLAYKLLREDCGGLVTELSDFAEADLSLIPEAVRPGYAKGYRLMEKFAESFPDNKKKILGLFGPVGTGKSFCASILANSLMKRDFRVLMYNAVRLNELFLNYHLAPIERKAGLTAPLYDCDLLIIDDLGAEPLLSNVTAVYLYALLAERQDKSIVVTSNLSVESLRERYGERVMSRLSDKSRSYFIYFNGPDLRLIEK